MSHILIAFAHEKTRRQMTDVMESAGIRVVAACGSGGETLRQCRRMQGGVILSGYKLRDMTAEKLYEGLPERVSLLVVATQAQLDGIESEGIYRLRAPVRRRELVDSVRMLLYTREAEAAPVPKRSAEEQLLIEQAKALLMTRNQMTEAQAHRFLQKQSMDAGLKMVQTALKVLDGHMII